MHVWIVEMKQGKKWEPCADAQLTKKDAEREKKYYWQHNNPDDEFRVRTYVPNKRYTPIRCITTVNTPKGE